MSLREDVQAANAARRELGEEYDDAVLRALVEARVDERVRRGLRSDIVNVTVAVLSIGLGVVFALVAERLGDLGGTVATIVAWAAILAVNVVHLRRR